MAEHCPHVARDVVANQQRVEGVIHSRDRRRRLVFGDSEERHDANGQAGDKVDRVGEVAGDGSETHEAAGFTALR